MSKAEPIATNPLATARQLWRLNKDGLLVLGSGVPLTAVEADEAIRASLPVRTKHSST